ncbi:cytochrome d ubiquinol oxidase subunit II [Phytoactinopolyspora halotolerans]|uniref:Cytochrome d ubiquinol oxidase subunit II n=1 Tax=Phytoactinopolyspora halotolerans TaxID=1981512 RepID=A0A6L9SDB3_9ACTN|nr:cytochrome d ubiquinol oxidase subunit II [Phytoactinopolyspora halotolerans]NEE02538.1 cytochrome d ubiquinol oxidase subunit II [Phytoactinopolyspora halotolerans]
MTDVVWLCILGFLLSGWFVLDGANLGLGMALRHVGRSGPERRLILTGLGPFLLGGEVWLVAAAGLLLGVFPALEKDLLYAYYPVIVAFVTAWLVRDMGVWFRSRRSSAVWQRGWERSIGAASGVFAFAWGMLLGNVVHGVPDEGMPGVGTLFGPYSLLWGVTVVAALLMHGAVFTALRMPRARRARAVRTARRAGGAVLALFGLISLTTVAFGIDLAQRAPVLIVQAMAIIAAIGAERLLTAGRLGWSYACTALVAVAPVLMAGIASAPRLLEGIADDSTLDVLAGIVVPALPVLIAVQAWMWHTFREPVTSRSATFF